MSAEAGNRNRRAVLVATMSLSVVLVAVFWLVVRFARVQGLPLYFLQLGLYAALFLLAVWGLTQERITVPVSARRALDALAWSIVGWLAFAVVVQVLGLAQIPRDLQVLASAPLWKIGAQILATWVFVGLVEELLFRGYFLEAFRRRLTRGTDRRRTAFAILVSSLFFSLWHLPSRIMWLVTGEDTFVTLLVSLVVLFALGLGFAYLYVRSNNLLLVALVHGLMDYPLVGADSQASPIILVVAIGCVEAARAVTSKQTKALRRTQFPATG